MERIQNDDSGGAQTIYFLHVNNLSRHADILYVREYAVCKGFGKPFFIFAGAYLFQNILEFSTF